MIDLNIISKDNAVRKQYLLKQQDKEFEKQISQYFEKFLETDHKEVEKIVNDYLKKIIKEQKPSFYLNDWPLNSIPYMFFKWLKEFAKNDKNAANLQKEIDKTICDNPSQKKVDNNPLIKYTKTIVNTYLKNQFIKSGYSTRSNPDFGTIIFLME